MKTSPLGVCHACKGERDAFLTAFIGLPRPFAFGRGRPLNVHHFEVGLFNGFADDRLGHRFVRGEQLYLSALHVHCRFGDAVHRCQFVLELATAACAQSAFDPHHPSPLPSFGFCCQGHAAYRGCQSSQYKCSSSHRSSLGVCFRRSSYQHCGLERTAGRMACTPLIVRTA